MLTETEVSFIQKLLTRPPLQTVEEVASESHETRRIPDPWIYVNRAGKLTTPKGVIVEEKCIKTTYLGNLEFVALQTIQDWANSNESGIALWFSPPHQGDEKRPASKIMISEIITQEDIKVLFNRAVVLDMNAEGLLNLANGLNGNKMNNPELLRSSPLFPSDQEFSDWFKKLAKITSQTKLIENGEDIKMKTATYTSLEEVPVLFRYGSLPYTVIYEAAREKGLIGEHPGSCPSSSSGKTAFASFFENSLVISAPAGEKTLDCTCPFCNQKVRAIISGGKIHCPNCQKTAPYSC